MLRLGSALRVAARHGYRHASTGGVAGPGIVELREYVVNPQYIGDYMKASTEGGDLRKRLVPLRLFGTPETGDILNLAQHFYHYECLDERQAARNAAQADPEWQQYIATIRPHLLQQRSTILVEAPFIHDMIGLEGMAKETIVPDDEASGPGIYELRRYKVALGYDRLMEFMEHMEKGMHVKLAACDPGSKLCSVLNSDVGDICEVCLFPVLLDFAMSQRGRVEIRLSRPLPG